MAGAFPHQRTHRSRCGRLRLPDFPRHVEFLSSLREAGVLVAGGPLPDDPGTGMTIVCAPDLDTARKALARAQLEDGAVTSGLLDVRVRPWRVAMTGPSA